MQESYTAEEIAEFLGADIRGDKDAQIYGLNTLNNAEGRLSFCQVSIDGTKASFVILSVEDSLTMQARVYSRKPILLMPKFLIGFFRQNKRWLMVVHQKLKKTHSSPGCSNW